MILHDKFGRQITDLRISVTDRCNFRCFYCRSADPENYRDHDEILSWPELDRLARIFLQLGIRKIRITGGEPLVREGVEAFIARLHSLGVEDLSMTTNGQLLAERCERLIASGLRRINISLDSLDPAKFEKITRTKSFSTVMKSIEIAQKVKAGELDPADVTEQVFAQHLYTRNLPDPDLLIRTSGEMRLSNFLLWQISYTELVVTHTLWPDFRKPQFYAALEDYNRRHRRFGGV